MVNVKEAFKIYKDKRMLAKIESWEQKKNIILRYTGWSRYNLPKKFWVIRRI
jgi:hypothetical protein